MRNGPLEVLPEGGDGDAARLLVRGQSAQLGRWALHMHGGDGGLATFCCTLTAPMQEAAVQGCMCRVCQCGFHSCMDQAPEVYVALWLKVSRIVGDRSLS